MKTTKPFSTISYNTVDFLTAKLDDLVCRRVISFYAFIKHYKEQDERKDHIHLIIFPNGQYQTDALFDYLCEPDLTDLTKKPLGIMPCQSSKWDHWYLYACHDIAYLASKQQTRQHHYLEQDFVSSDSDYLHELIANIDLSKYSRTAEFIKQVDCGASFDELVRKGFVPAPQFTQWRALYDHLHYNTLSRNNGQTHTPNTANGIDFDDD